MTDRPIIFSGPMVRALLEGRKTQTRRVLKPQPVPCLSWGDPPPGTYPSAAGWSRLPCAPGDRLWVREAWGINDSLYEHPIPKARPSDLEPHGLCYLATETDAETRLELRWRPSIHMPRWASRLTLTVTEVRVQRLQDISEADAVAEGVNRLIGSKGPNFFTREVCGKWNGSFNAATAQEVYADLWNSIHGPEAWGANPWVAAISFAVRQGNIDK